MRELSEQTILITGSTDGLGQYLAREVARAGAQVIVHGRNAARAKSVRDDIVASGDARVDVLLADLADLDQVARLADRVAQRYSRVDVLVNNAGIGGTSGGRQRREVSANGIELRFAVNYLAGYLLTHRLLPLLVDSAPARIVNVSSLGQRAIDFSDPMLERRYDGGTAYAQSKLAQIMFTFDLAEDLSRRDVTVNAIHPATYMNTTMVRTAGIAPWSTVEEGGGATLRLMANPALDGVTGRFFDGTQESRTDPQAYDPAARRRLRELSDGLIASAGIGSPTG